MKIPVVQRKEYVLYLERCYGLSFVHCDVFRWNKTTQASLAKDWETICLLHNEPIYAYHVVGDKKHLKFLQIYGFTYAFSMRGNDLKEVQIFRKEVPYGN